MEGKLHPVSYPTPITPTFTVKYTINGYELLCIQRMVLTEGVRLIQKRLQLSLSTMGTSLS